MAREVRHDANGPDVLDEDDLGDDGKVFICRCGLSDTKPLCDGSHNGTTDEEEDTLYKYEDDDDEKERRVIDELVFADE
ncbi:CDGSH iron-sulfur domain-containing protein [Natronomonas halophila]|uniref:CDGSH iron-sulfur domain-containing protein n=1 Tax=Natronomonas halophila TaxID=2747817 RepID=UPI0015B57137|nr:CDGSH iron-sulfur domain-containing protein [Natronomonas halophila]QLD87329.1 CDGSH iron-sulfur domain-containing protein [Natronomonas halophila]